MKEELTKKRCVPCEGGVPPLDPNQVKTLNSQVKGWEWKRAKDGGADKIEKAFFYKNFVEAMAFVNKVAEIAETEGHHPDIFVHYNQVTIFLWTHAVTGLTENDFIVAAKVDALGGKQK